MDERAGLVRLSCAAKPWAAGFEIRCRARLCALSPHSTQGWDTFSENKNQLHVIKSKMVETPRAESAQRITLINTYRENVAWSGLPHRRPRAHIRESDIDFDRPDYVCSVSRLYLRGLDNTTPVPSALPKQAGETLRRGHDEGRGGDVLAEGRVGPVAPLR